MEKLNKIWKKATAKFDKKESYQKSETTRLNSFSNVRLEAWIVHAIILPWTP